MQIVSKTVNVPNKGEVSTDYIESELKKMDIIPLRWSIVKISKDFFTINCAYDKIGLG